MKAVENDDENENRDEKDSVILFLLFAFFSLSACEPGNESSYNPVEQPGTSGESSGDNSDQTEGNAPGDTSGESTEEEPDVERPDEPNVPSQGVQGRYLVVYCSRSGTYGTGGPNRSGQRCVVIFGGGTCYKPYESGLPSDACPGSGGDCRDSCRQLSTDKDEHRRFRCV